MATQSGEEEKKYNWTDSFDFCRTKRPVSDATAIAAVRQHRRASAALFPSTSSSFDSPFERDFKERAIALLRFTREKCRENAVLARTRLPLSLDSRFDVVASRRYAIATLGRIYRYLKLASHVSEREILSKFVGVKAHAKRVEINSER